MNDKVFAVLSLITATASAPGITVTVNLEGRLVDLSLDPHALAATPADLAATIFRLTHEAGAKALNDGIAALTPHVPDDVATELRALVLPTPREEPTPEDDFATVETWAIPH